MKPHRPIFQFALLALLAVPMPALAGLSVEVWTDRGTDAVYKSGDPIQIQARASEDAYLLIYEIDAEGYVHLLHPGSQSRGFVEGKSTVTVPDQNSDFELTAQGPDGLGYVVAIVSLDPFLDLPWYLRPYDPQAAELGYAGREEGAAADEEGITAEGHIVGDPFVAMERIRRRVIRDPNDGDTFSSSYTSYYIGHAVRYPRYLCGDCHRPDQWSWWSGYDPYYTTCSVFDFRVNWGWTWGPSYWTGFVPYYVYTYRPDCPPRWQNTVPRGGFYSSWDGPRRWNKLWNGGLTRYKADPPVGYVPPTQWNDSRPDGGNRGPRPLPPGYLGGGISGRVPRGRYTGVREVGGQPRQGSGSTGAPRERRRLGDALGTAPEPVKVPVQRDSRGAPPPPSGGSGSKDGAKSQPPRVERPRSDTPPPPPPPSSSPRQSRGGTSSGDPSARKSRSALLQPMRWFKPSYNSGPQTAGSNTDAPAFESPKINPPAGQPASSNPPPRAAAPPPSQAPAPAVKAPAPAPSLPAGVQRLGMSIASKRGG